MRVMCLRFFCVRAIELLYFLVNARMFSTFLALLHCPDFVDDSFVGAVGLIIFLIRK